MEVLRQIGSSGLFVSSLGIVAQMIPAIPEDLKSWPAVAIVGCIALSSLALLAYTVRVGAKNMSELARSLGQMTEQERARGVRTDELCRKLGDTNKQIATVNERFAVTNANLEARPCFKERP